MATLTRAEMEEVIRNGGSILHKGQHLTRIEHLPTEGDLAEGDAAATQAALDGITAQRAALDEQERKILAAQGQGATKTKGGKSKGANAPDSSPATGATGAVDPGAEGATGGEGA